MIRERILKVKNYLIEDLIEDLFEKEKSKATLEKHIRGVETFYAWMGDKELNKLCVLNYKEYLSEKYAVASVNSMRSSMNGFFTDLEWYELRAKTIKVQKQIFASNGKELTKKRVRKTAHGS